MVFRLESCFEFMFLIDVSLTIHLVGHVRAVRALGSGSWAVGTGAQVVRAWTGTGDVGRAIGIALAT